MLTLARLCALISSIPVKLPCSGQEAVHHIATFFSGQYLNIKPPLVQVSQEKHASAHNIIK
jgi:hypothetical protein